MKIITRCEAIKVSEKAKAAGQKVVFTNGCFDILHAGHVRYLATARDLGDLLIVGLNSDDSVRKLKGSSRPVNRQDDRAEVLAALASVDYVVVFDEVTAETIVAEVKPNIYAKGGDYSVKSLPEAAIVEAYGGQIALVPEVPGRSSSKIIEKIMLPNN